MSSSQSPQPALLPRRAARALVAALAAVALGCLLAPTALAGGAPVAAFHRDPPSSVGLLTGQTATFTSDSTTGSALSWAIDGVPFGSGRTVAHAFADPGFHVVVLKATLNGQRDAAVSVFGVNSPLYPLPLKPPTPPAPELMSPFPTVRLVGFPASRGARITLLAVRGAPRVARVTVRCTGTGCPFRSRRRTATTGRVRFSKWPRVLVAGARIEVFVRAPDVIGKYSSFRFRAGKAPRRADCLLRPGATKPTSCT